MSPPTARLVSLGDCCRVVNGTTPRAGVPSHWVGDIVWVTPTDLGKLGGVYIGRSARMISQNALDSHNLTLRPAGSVVLSSRAPIGHLGIASVPLCTNQGCKTLVPLEGVKSEYLFYSLLRVIPELRAMGSGATFAEISKSQVEGFKIPLPTLAEQDQIAAALARALAVVDAARRAAEDRLAAAEALPPAYLRGVFETADASRWSEFTLGALVRSPIRTGISKPGSPTSNKRCLTLSAVRGRTLLLEASKPVDVNDSDAEGNWLQPGCFYVVRGNGNRELVGRGAFAPDTLRDRMLFPDLLFQLDLSEAVDPIFFWHLWCSAPVRREIEARARTAAGIYKINTSNLASLPLRLPAIAEQRLIAYDLSLRVEAADSILARCREELAAIEAIPTSLLRAAFNGGS